METIDITPTWEQILPMYIAVIRDGSAEGRKLALEDLRRMAQAADLYNQQCPSKAVQNET